MKKVNYKTDDDNRIQSITTYPINDAIPIIEIDDDFSLQIISDYKVIDGNLVYDPLPTTPEPEPTESTPTWSELAAALKEGVNDV